MSRYFLKWNLELTPLSPTRLELSGKSTKLWSPQSNWLNKEALRVGWLYFYCGPCKQSTISAYKCLQVTKLKPEDNQSRTANFLKLYLINNFLALFYPISKSLSLSSCLEKEMATHSSILAWKILWTEECGRLLFMESWRVGHDWATSLELLLGEHSAPFQVCHYFKYIFAQICLSLSANTTL